MGDLGPVTPDFHSNLNASVSSADVTPRSYSISTREAGQGSGEKPPQCGILGQILCYGWKGKEASWAGVWRPFALGRFQLLDHDPSSHGAELWGVGAESGLRWMPGWRRLRPASSRLVL